MKKLFGILTCMFTLSFTSLAGELMLAWDLNTNNVSALMSNTVVYLSTNNFATTNLIGVPEPQSNVIFYVTTGQVYSAYVTAQDKQGLQSEPSNQIRYQRFTAKVGQTNLLSLEGSTNWTGAILTETPTNGIITGTPPNLMYVPTNTVTAVKDFLTYSIPDMWEGMNITNYYSIHFLYENDPPSIEMEPDYIK